MYVCMYLHNALTLSSRSNTDNFGKKSKAKTLLRWKIANTIKEAAGKV